LAAFSAIPAQGPGRVSLMESEILSLLKENYFLVTTHRAENATMKTAC
jgi:hypothetical protein